MSPANLSLRCVLAVCHRHRGAGNTMACVDLAAERAHLGWATLSQHLGKQP